MTQQKKKKKPTAAELKKRAKRKIAAAKKKLGVKRLPLRTSTSSTRFVLGKLLRSGRRSWTSMLRTPRIEGSPRTALAWLAPARAATDPSCGSMASRSKDSPSIRAITQSFRSCDL